MAYTFHIVAQNVSTFEIAVVVNQSIMSRHKKFPARMQYSECHEEF